MKFPVYRKYSNNKSYFKVLDETHFEEIQVIGSQYTVYFFEAKILPDRVLIQDMINIFGGGWVEISEDDYQLFHQKCVQEYKLLELKR